MVRIFSHYIAVGALVELFADFSIFFLAFLLAIFTHRTQFGGQLQPNDFAIALLLGVCVSLLCATFGIYRKHATLVARLVRAAAAIALACLAMELAFVMLVPDAPTGKAGVWLTLPYGVLGLVVLWRVLRNAREFGVGVRRIVIVGSGAPVEFVASTVGGLANRRYEVVGVFPAGTEEAPPTAGAGLRSLAGADLCDVVRRERIDDVVVAVRERRGGVLPIRQLLDCRAQGINVMDLTDFSERLRGEFPLESLRASWLIYASGFHQGWLRRLIKRIFDVVSASILLLLALPVMALTAIAIRLESPGSVIYRQQRVGLGGRSFEVLKFRSMRQDAEQAGAPQWARARDPRITRVGRLIRKVRIDELPQLFNVLRGEMSLVGPRPERPEFVEKLKSQIPFYDLRHSVKPGLTGWAQVRFNYAASLEDSRRKLQFDLYYIKNHTLFLDFIILLETVHVVLTGEGAQ